MCDLSNGSSIRSANIEGTRTGVGFCMVSIVSDVSNGSSIHFANIEGTRTGVGFCMVSILSDVFKLRVVVSGNSRSPPHTRPCSAPHTDRQALHIPTKYYRTH